MKQTLTSNTDKSNAHNNHKQNANTESYSDFMDNMEYFSVFGFLLAGLAYELAHERKITD